MRDRIDEVLKELEIYWKANPDLRLMQLLLNFGSPSCPTYHIEEEFILKALRRENAK
jgi:uncharacterized protein YihD (DUF1040 family)